MEASKATFAIGNGSIPLLGPTTMDLHKWPSLDHRNYQNDAVLVGVGTIAQILQHGYTTIAAQGIETTSVAVLAGASTSVRDLDGLKVTARIHPGRIAVGKGWFPRREVYHPNSPLVIAQPLGRGLINGLEANPLRAVQLLQDSPLFLKEVVDFASTIVQSYNTHRMVGVKAIYWGSFGGTEPLERLVIQRVASQVHENWRVRVKLLPSEEEHLSLANARGELYRLITNGLPANHLIILKQNTKRGGHDDDDALLTGLITLTGTASVDREMDGATLLRVLRQAGAGWVEARPAVVSVPLARVGKRWLFWRNTWLVKVPEYESGRMLELVLGKARGLLEKEPDALHILTVSGLFSDQEMSDFKRAAVSLLKPGHVVPVVNRLYPKVEGELGRWVMVDFVSAPELPQSVVHLFQDGKTTFRASGVQPQQFLANVPPPEESKTAHQVAEALQQIGEAL